MGGIEEKNSQLAERIATSLSVEAGYQGAFQLFKKEKEGLIGFTGELAIRFSCL